MPPAAETTQREIEALTGKRVSVIRHIGRLSDSFIASYIDDAGWQIGNHQDTEAQALAALLADVRATLTQQAAA